MDNMNISVANISNISTKNLNIVSYFNSKNSYQIDFDKVKTVEDCILLIRVMIAGLNSGYEADVSVYDNSPFYEKLKHLAKE